jgi:hypothetical protein
MTLGRGRTTIDPYLGGRDHTAPPDGPECPCIDGEDCPAHGRVCERCAGHGWTAGGTYCPTCSGTGRLPLAGGACDGR